MATEPEIRGSQATSGVGVTFINAAVPTGTAAGDLLLLAVTVLSTTGVKPKLPGEATLIAVSGAFSTAGNKRICVLYEKVATVTDVVNGFVRLEVEGAEAPTKLFGVVLGIKTGTYKTPVEAHAGWTVEESLTPEYGSLTPTHINALALGFASFTGTLSSDPPAGWTIQQTYTAYSPHVVSHACGESLAETPSSVIGHSSTQASAWCMVLVGSAASGGPVSVKAAAGVKVSGFGLSAGAPVIRAAAMIRMVIASKGGPVAVRAGAKVGVYAPPVIYEPIEIGAAAAVSIAGEPARANISNVRAGARVSTAGVKLSGGVVRIRAGARVGVKVVISLTPPTRMVIRGTTTRAQVRGATTTARLRGG